MQLHKEDPNKNKEETKNSFQDKKKHIKKTRSVILTENVHSLHPQVQAIKNNETPIDTRLIWRGFSIGILAAILFASWAFFFSPLSPFKHNLLKEDENQFVLNSQDSYLKSPPFFDPSLKHVIDSPFMSVRAPVPLLGVPALNPLKTKSAYKNPIKYKPRLVFASQSVYHYNVKNGGPIINVLLNKEVQISMDTKFKHLYLSGFGNQLNQFQIPSLPQGNLYWRLLETPKEIHLIKIVDANSINLKISSETKLTTQDNIQWSSSSLASFYKLEVYSDIKARHLLHSFSTHKNQFAAKDLSEGTWYIRVRALNLEKGSFDFSPVTKIIIEKNLVKNDPITEVGNDTESATHGSPSDTPPVEPTNPIDLNKS